MIRSVHSRALLLALGATLAFPVASQAAPRCRFLVPVGGDGTSNIVVKQVQRPKLLGHSNWNTDFIVDRPYSFYKFFFTAISSDPNATYPVEGFMKFTDGTSLQVINDRMTPPVGTGRMFGPFYAVTGKQSSQMNFKVGTSDDPGATGFSYRISVQGCE
jgi:hypothetical protein